MLAILTVNTLADSVDLDAGVTSLREAITAANSQAGDDVIDFSVTGTINLNGALPDLSSNLQILGPGAASLTVRRDTGGDYRIFTVVSGQTVALNGLTIANGRTSFGGAIHNNGALTVESSTLSGNLATNGGGGIYNNGTLTAIGSMFSGNSSTNDGGGITNFNMLTVDNSTFSNNASYQGGGISNKWLAVVDRSTFSGNSGFQQGGGIYSESATLVVDRSTFSSNFTPGAYGGGGIKTSGGGTASVHNSILSGNFGPVGGGINNGGTLTMEDCTLSGNSAAYGGGVYNHFGAITVQNSTLSGNSSNHFGGGIYNNTDGSATLRNSTLSGNSSNVAGGLYNLGTSTLYNTIVAGNTGLIPDIDGTFTSGSSHNLIGVGTNASGISHGSNGNLVGTAAAPINPLLGSLQDNGGPTQTLALLPGSPAINAGDNSLIPAGVITDQRGAGFARIDSGTVDIGAFELVLNRPPVANASGPYVVVRGGAVQLDASGTTDPDQPNTTLTYEWDFDGDGYDDATGIAPTFSADGVDMPRSQTIGLRVTDNGGLMSTATATVEIVVIALVPDTCQFGATMLAVGGTLGNDHIVFNPGAAAGQISVSLNGDPRQLRGDGSLAGLRPGRSRRHPGGGEHRAFGLVVRRLWRRSVERGRRGRCVDGRGGR